MISIELIRREPKLVQERLALKDNSISLETILELDKEYRFNLSKVNELRSKRNKVSEDIAKARKAEKDKEQKEMVKLVKILSRLN